MTSNFPNIACQKPIPSYLIRCKRKPENAAKMLCQQLLFRRKKSLPTQHTCRKKTKNAIAKNVVPTMLKVVAKKVVKR